MIVLEFSAGEGFERRSMEGGDEVGVDTREDLGVKGGVLRRGHWVGSLRRGEKVEIGEERESGRGHWVGSLRRGEKERDERRSEGKEREGQDEKEVMTDCSGKKGIVVGMEVTEEEEERGMGKGWSWRGKGRRRRGGEGNGRGGGG
ncbi:uncharacterized protein A4U43_C08F4130 [Asparagus officinalis]|nr:uncharacterized protein A4U43_C08F4130 [Asparagus officinalis]